MYMINMKHAGSYDTVAFLCFEEIETSSIPHLGIQDSNDSHKDIVQGLQNKTYWVNTPAIGIMWWMILNQFPRISIEAPPKST